MASSLSLRSVASSIGSRLVGPAAARPGLWTRQTVVAPNPASSRRQARWMAAAASDGNSKLQELVEAKNADNAVVVWCKSWCPFCSQVKEFFDKLEIEYLSIDLDNFHEEAEIMDALVGISGQRTVPNIFIGGQHVGGCDDTMDKYRSGELKKLLDSAGVSYTEA